MTRTEDEADYHTIGAFISNLSDEAFDDLRKQGGDFYKLLVVKALGIELGNVMTTQRSVAKYSAFYRMYSQQRGCVPL